MEIPWQVATGIGSVAAIIVAAVWALGWWLRGYMYEIKDSSERQIDKLEDAIAKKYDDHELKDQKRHEDNLYRLSAQDTRLAVIETRLTTLLKNGHAVR